MYKLRGGSSQFDRKRWARYETTNFIYVGRSSRRTTLKLQHVWKTFWKKKIHLSHYLFQDFRKRTQNIFIPLKYGNELRDRGQNHFKEMVEPHFWTPFWLISKIYGWTPFESLFDSFQKEMAEPHFDSFQKDMAEAFFDSFQKDIAEPLFDSFQKDMAEPHFGQSNSNRNATITVLLLKSQNNQGFQLTVGLL